MKHPTKILEKKVKSQMDDIAKKYGDACYWLNPATGGYGESGHPDKVLCLNGTFIGAEAKGSNGKLSPLQVRQLRRIWQAGGIACVIGPEDLGTYWNITEAVSCGNMEGARMFALLTLTTWKVY